MYTFDRPVVSAIEDHSNKGKTLLHEACRSGAKYSEAIEEYKLALNHAILFKKEVIPCILNLGAAQISAGKCEEGRKIINLLLEDNSYSKEVCSNCLLYGHVLYHLGLANAKSGQEKKAVDLFENAIKEYRKDEGAVNFMSETMVELAQLRIKSEQYQQAFALLDEATEHYSNELSDYEKSCKCILLQVDILLKSKPAFALERIKSLLKTCLLLSSKIDDISLQCQIKLEIGNKYFSFGQSQDAMNCYDMLLERIEDSEDLMKMKATLLYRKAEVFSYQKNLLKSSEYAILAANLYGKLGLRNFQGKSFYLVANNRRNEGQHKKSYHTYLHALQAFKDSDNNEGQWRTYEAIADVCMIEDDFKEASKYYQLAYKMQACGDEKSDHLIEKLSVALSQSSSFASNSFTLTPVNRLSFENLQGGQNNQKEEEKEMTVKLKSSLKQTTPPEMPMRPTTSLAGRISSSSCCSSPEDGDKTSEDLTDQLKKVVEKLNKENGEKKKTSFVEDVYSTSIDISSSSSDASTPRRHGNQRHPSTAGRRDEVPMRYANRGLSALNNYNEGLPATSSPDSSSVDLGDTCDSKIPFALSEEDNDVEVKSEDVQGTSMKEGITAVDSSDESAPDNDDDESSHLTDITSELQNDDVNSLSDSSSEGGESTHVKTSEPNISAEPATISIDAQKDRRKTDKKRKARKERERKMRKNRNSKACTIM